MPPADLTPLLRRFGLVVLLALCVNYISGLFVLVGAWREGCVPVVVDRAGGLGRLPTVQCRGAAEAPVRVLCQEKR
jgi:hypothetical protein